jgi:hypothetical protein
MDRAQSVAFVLLCVFALSLPGCATGPGFGKAEPGQPQVKRPAATEKKTLPPEEPAATETKPQSSEETEAPPKPMKPPAIGGSGG